jgi:proteasome assembly chaperone (PAC2) family protein
VLLAAFDGWNDAGEAATTALDAIADGLAAETFATIDPEDFYDFQATRPTVRMVDGHRRIEWPSVELRAAHLPAADHDLIVVRGHEPNLRWRTFAEEIVQVASSLGVEMMITVGALLADVPHTRPVQVVSSAGDRELAERLGLNVSRYEGPTGILGVLGNTATKEGIPTVGLWAALPHYLNLAPNPWGAMALVRSCGGCADGRRHQRPGRRDRRLRHRRDQLVDENPELAGYISGWKPTATTRRRPPTTRRARRASPTSRPRSWWRRSSATCATTPAAPGAETAAQTVSGPPGLRPGGPVDCEIRSLWGHRAHVCGLQPLRPLGDVELHQLSLVERPAPLHLDRGEVHEDVLAVGTGDEAVPLVRVEPLDDTAGHELLSLPSPSPSTAANVPGRYQTRRAGTARTALRRQPSPLLGRMLAPGQSCQ